MRDFRAGVWMQTLLRDPAAGLMHSCIYFGFLWLFIATVVLEIDHQLPDNLKFLHGGVYEGYAFAADLAGVVFIVGILVGDRPSLHRAAVPHPDQDQARRRGDPAAPSSLIGVTGFFTEALRIARGRPSDFEKWSFVGYPIVVAVRRLVARATLETLHRVAVGHPLRRVRRVPRSSCRPRSSGT